MGKYLLPDGETLVTDLKCAVVVYPDSDRYRRALWGAISQLTKYWMWEPDGAGGEYDAADSWDEAYEATLENFGMLETIIDHIDDVEDLLRALQTLENAGAPCCENLAPTNELHEYDDTVYPDTPPATWGDGETVADASDWEQLVCGAAHAYVDHLKSVADEIDMVVTASAIVVGVIAGLLGLLGGAGIILKIGYGTAAAIVTGLVAGANEFTFGNTSDNLEAARQDIVCAIVHEGPDQLAAAVEAAIGAAPWSLFYSFIDYASARNIILEGSHGSDFLGVSRRTDCDCGADFTEAVNFGSDFDGRGNWTGGRTLTTDTVQVRDGYTPLSRDHFGGSIYDVGSRLKLTITYSNNSADTCNDFFVQTWLGGGVADSEVFPVAGGGLANKQTATYEYTKLATDSGDLDPDVRINTNCGKDIAIYDVLIEIFA